jgi:hypothetical protein
MRSHHLYLGTLIILAAIAASAAELLKLSATLEPKEDFGVNNCSLYCAAYPKITVSAQLQSYSRNHYGAKKLADGEKTTAWIVAGGPREWIEFAFEPEGFHPDVPKVNRRLGVDKLYILNGYAKSPQHWKEHSRVHELELSVDGRPVSTIVLLDHNSPQTVDLPPTLLQRGMRFRFTIRTIFPGSRYQETAVSEIRLDGYGHH